MLFSNLGVLRESIDSSNLENLGDWMMPLFFADWLLNGNLGDSV